MKTWSPQGRFGRAIRAAAVGIILAWGASWARGADEAAPQRPEVKRDAFAVWFAGPDGRAQLSVFYVFFFGKGHDVARVKPGSFFNMDFRAGAGRRIVHCDLAVVPAQDLVAYETVCTILGTFDVPAEARLADLQKLSFDVTFTDKDGKESELHFVIPPEKVFRMAASTDRLEKGEK